MTTPRRARQWSDTLLNIQLGNGAAITPIDVLANLTGAPHTVTIVRTIVNLVIYPDGVANAVDGAAHLYMGLAMVGDEAAAAGVQYDPHVDIDQPRDGWLWRGMGLVISQQSSGTGEAFRFATIREDLRGSRKVERSVMDFVA